MAADVLACNLTRFGDLLQSQPLIDDLHQSGRKVDLVCLDNFAPAASLLKNVNTVWPLPGARLMALTDKNWPDAVNALLRYINSICSAGAPQYFLNLTPTLPARLLSRILANYGSKVLGFGMDEYGFGLNHGVWASFFAVAARKRANAPFNMADMLRRMALPLTGQCAGGFMLARPDSESAAWAKEFIRRHAPCADTGAPALKLAAFQLGASESRRRWPVENFRNLGQRLWAEEALCPVLLGSGSESGLAREYGKGARHPFIDATGKTDLRQLAALLRETRILITNDTGTMHLAAGHGVPILAFFLATAQPWDTSPLLPDCCCLEPAIPCHPCGFGLECPNENKCGTQISAESAGDLALAWLRQGSWAQGVTPRVNEECRVWITGVDKKGFTSVSRPGSQAYDERTLWLSWLKIFWSQFLDDIDHPGGNADKNFQLPEPYAALPKPDVAASVIAHLKLAINILESIEACGALAGKNSRASQIFLRNCERLQAILDSCSPLGTLAGFWHEFRQSQGADLDYFMSSIKKLSFHLKCIEGAL